MIRHYITGRNERGTSFGYKRDDPDDSLTYYCGPEQVKIFELQNQIIDLIEAAPFTQALRESFMKLLEEWAEARIDKEREDWYDDHEDNCL